MMLVLKRPAARVLPTIGLCLLTFAFAAFDPIDLLHMGNGSAAAQTTNPAEKDAFDDAKALGTVEAWDAFLSNYPSGFHADLARAYVKKLAEQPAAPAAAPTPPPQAQGHIDTDFPIAAGSWGGIVRDGPGQSYKKLDSLEEGEPVSLMGVTQELDNGFPWFRIWYGGKDRNKQGHMWGGILCAVGTARADVFQMCPAKSSAAKTAPTCATRGNDSENMICANEKLSGLDTELNEQFNMRVSNITSEANGGTQADVAVFRNEQRAWLRQRNACGGDTGCLTQQYNARLKTLRELNQPE